MPNLPPPNPLDAILAAKRLTYQETALRSQVAIRTVRRIRDGEPIRRAQLLAVANFLGVEPVTIYPKVGDL